MIPLFKVFMSGMADDNVLTVLDSGHIAQGVHVDTFEKRLSAFFGTEVVTVNAGTSALDLALHLCEVGPGDEVITTAQTCVATNTHIVLRGATPVFVNVFPDSGLIDPDDVKRNLTGKTKAVVAVDWAGHPCNYTALRALGVPVIEDAAHAVGTTHLGTHVAQTGGDYVCFSFQAIKHLTTGDGGALKVPPDQLDRARRLRWFGLDRNTPGLRFDQDIPEAGFKYHMNDIAAAIGLANEPHLKSLLEKHRANATWLRATIDEGAGVQLPPLSSESSWWLFTLRVPHVSSFIEHMAKRGVTASPVHSRNDTKTAFRHARRSTNLKGLDYFATHQVSIPVGWWLSQADLNTIAEAVASCT